MGLLARALLIEVVCLEHDHPAALIAARADEGIRAEDLRTRLEPEKPLLVL